MTTRESRRALHPVAASLGIAVLVFLSKLPWVFTTLGEQDQARFILAALVYAHDGAQTIRPYAMLTSPLWTLPMALLSKAFAADQLVLLSNVVGWIAGAAVAALAYGLLRQLGSSRAWAAAGAVVATWVPGAFYASLYGYPSQWALPFLLATATAYLRCLDATTRRSRGLWFVLAGLGFCVLSLLKVDFALSGTLLVGVAVVRRRLLDAWTLALPVPALVAAVLVLGVSRLLIEQTYGDFASGWASLYPGRTSPLADPFAITTLYSVGLGTALLGAAAALVGLLRPSTRGRTARALLGWAVAVLPLWLFWLTRPPMSSRHALPGAVLTALFAALVAGWQLRRWPALAPVWVVVVLGVNASLGVPDYDFNYRPSGNLIEGARLNRRAFQVGLSISDAIAAPQDRIKAILGEPDREVLGGIDLLPLVEYSMAVRSAQTRCVGRIRGPTDPHTRDIVFTSESGNETRLLRYVDPRRVGLYRGSEVAFYAPWGLQGVEVNVHGVEVVEFDPIRLYEEMFGERPPVTGPGPEHRMGLRRHPEASPRAGRAARASMQSPG